MQNLKNKKILIYGTGAVGGFYGGMLAKDSNDVTFIARGKNFYALKEKGLTLKVNDDVYNFPIKVFENIENLGEFDYIIICTKSHNTNEDCKAIKPCVGEHSTVLSFQNGVENEEIILNNFGEKNSIGGLVFVASKLVEPGVVYQFGYNGGFIGEFNKEKTERVEYLSDIFQHAGIDMKVSEDILSALWNKLLWNTTFNPTSVLLGKTVDKLVDEDKNLLVKIMDEVNAVATAHGYKIRPDYIEFNLMRSKNLPGFKTSMLQDFEKGNIIELEGIAGIVIKKGKEKNISTPTIQKVYDDVKKMLALKTFS